MAIPPTEGTESDRVGSPPWAQPEVLLVATAEVRLQVEARAVGALRALGGRADAAEGEGVQQGVPLRHQAAVLVPLRRAARQRAPEARRGGANPSFSGREGTRVKSPEKCR